MRWRVCTLFLVGCTSPSYVLDTEVKAVWDPAVGAVVIDADFTDEAPGEIRDHEFDPSQRILVGIAGQTVTLVQTPISIPPITLIEYEGTATLAEPDGALGILEVTNDSSDMTATFTLPDSFELGAFPATLGTNMAATVTWTPSRPDMMSWAIESSCIELERPPTEISDTGSLGLGSLLVSSDPCTAKLVIDRHRDGAARPNGASSGIQRRTIQFVVTP